MTSGTKKEIAPFHISTDLNASDMISKNTKEAVHIKHRDNVANANVFSGIEIDVEALIEEGVTNNHYFNHTEPIDSTQEYEIVD